MIGASYFDMSAKILIIEDDADILFACRDLLEGEGFAVDSCANGREALAFLDSHPEPCLILLDMLMPIMNGREFMAIFAGRPHTIVPIPVYLVSANASAKIGVEIGCRGFLRKPFDVEGLLKIAQDHCKAVPAVARYAG